MPLFSSTDAMKAALFDVYVQVGKWRRPAVSLETWMKGYAMLCRRSWFMVPTWAYRRRSLLSAVSLAVTALLIAVSAFRTRR